MLVDPHVPSSVISAIGVGAGFILPAPGATFGRH